jgi:hypothetical protein
MVRGADPTRASRQWHTRRLKTAGRARPYSIAAEWSIHAESQLCVGTGRLWRAV